VAIVPPTDLVLDVARAANPDAYRVAAERLARLRASQPSTEVFMPQAAPAPANRTQSTDPAVATTSPASANPTSTGGSPRRRLDPYGQFEAFVLQSFVQSMLPKNAANVFGKGSAGEFWKSMLAEKMGDELARSGQVGIARRLAAGPSHPAQPASTVTASPPIHPVPLAASLTRVPVIPVNPDDVSAPAADVWAATVEPASERS
jgi:peptidoglycan hydrolase FlgJ